MQATNRLAQPHMQAAACSVRPELRSGYRGLADASAVTIDQLLDLHDALLERTPAAQLGNGDAGNKDAGHKRKKGAHSDDSVAGGGTQFLLVYSVHPSCCSESKQVEACMDWSPSCLSGRCSPVPTLCEIAAMLKLCACCAGQQWQRLDAAYQRFASFRDSSMDRWHRKTMLMTGSGALRSNLKALNQSLSAQASRLPTLLAIRLS